MKMSEPTDELTLLRDYLSHNNSKEHYKVLVQITVK